MAAETRYKQALRFAQQADDAGLVTVVRRNRARLARGSKQALTELQAAKEAVVTVEWPYEQVDLLLGIAVEAQRSMGEEAGETRDDAAKQQSASTVSQDLIHGFVELAYDALQQALTEAERINAPRLRSLANGHLGALYEYRKRLAEARMLTEQAIQAVQPIEAHELLLEWESQMARLMRVQNDDEGAIAAYRRAVYHIQTIRRDIPIEYHDGHSSFRETLAPVYFGLADLLLQKAAKQTDPQIEQTLLHEARDAVERIKASELRDYLKDPCIVARTEEIETVSPTTAVLYPIILPDRVELLASIGNRLHRVAVNVAGPELLALAKVVSQGFRAGEFFATHAQDLHRFLIQPIAPLLEEHGVDTLVFVPDGPLRALPMAALWDGEDYLIERYAVATAPGLSLLDPRPLPREQMRTLLAGISRPGPAINKLPKILRESLLNNWRQQSDHHRRGVPVTVAQLQSLRLDPSRPEQDNSQSTELIQALSLQGVEKEITHLSKQLTGEVMLDEAFRLNNFAKAVERQPYQVVHIASHGVFGGTGEDNFVLTYDETLNMNELAALLKPKQLAQRPVELLVLSACQTAEGDDRTPLGLSGVALKSGARSVLGSLWPVADEATQELLVAFYEHLLENPDLSKAQALQQAQRKLIGHGRFQDAAYWAPFILVGNWL